MNPVCGTLHALESWTWEHFDFWLRWADAPEWPLPDYTPLRDALWGEA